MERVYYGINTENLLINDEWVKENVIPLMDHYEQCSDEDELLENVWEFLDKYRNNSMMVGDVIFPVESNILRRCVEFDVKNRNFDGPYPLLDISSMLYAIGINPNEKREEFIMLCMMSK